MASSVPGSCSPTLYCLTLVSCQTVITICLSLSYPYLRYSLLWVVFLVHSSDSIWYWHLRGLEYSVFYILLSSRFVLYLSGFLTLYPFFIFTLSYQLRSLLFVFYFSYLSICSRHSSRSVFKLERSVHAFSCVIVSHCTEKFPLKINYIMPCFWNWFHEDSSIQLEQTFPQKGLYFSFILKTWVLSCIG